MFRKRVIIWDSFRCHSSSKTKDILKQLKIESVVIPGGCTKYIQPADVSWNKPFKEKIQELHDTWLSVGDIPLTRGGNPAPPPPQVYLAWIVQAWDSISTELIKKSFKCCGIGIPADGSEDNANTDNKIINGGNY